jgi:AbrB family looped-hinge helix DNA binding protein
MTQTVIQVGNSQAVVIPNEIRTKVGLKKGSKIDVELAADGKTVLLSKAGTKKTSSSITPEFIKILEGVNKRYGPALRKLAKL